MTKIQLKISLDKTDPLIWRRLLIPNSLTFFDLHHVLQIAMGWRNSHLFDLRVGDYTLGFIDDDAPDDLADANLITADSLLSKVGMKFYYLYDFGDSWQHTIEVEELSATNENFENPVCLGGEQNCPPEDCGGIPGFYNMLTILKDKTHLEFPDMYAWAGRYNPKKFNLARINKELPTYKKYMKHWKK